MMLQAQDLEGLYSIPSEEELEELAMHEERYSSWDDEPRSCY